MPELPEVETVCRGLNAVTPHRAIVGGDVLLDSTIAHPVSVADFLTGLQGCAIDRWQRRGKYLLAKLIRVFKNPQKFVSGGYLGVHLRMTGQLLWCHSSDKLQKHTRVRLFFADDRELRFVDQRTFGKMWWVPPDLEPPEAISGLRKLGPEPFSEEFSVEYFAGQLQKRQKSIKTALLDQAIVAGAGNIYADEALFLSKIPPTQICSHLTPDEIDRLRTALIRVLQDSIDAGGTTFSNFLNVEGINGNYGGVAWVYNRTGQPCRVCQTPIVRVKLGGRSSHFCPQCQHRSMTHYP
ncbi:MAG TPA: DNA-formamidopyrimidine glycosylase [Oscillatoriales cyanobacterium M59_W2019_021]|nr:MAG: DNA-formamidopyrimidine glycosylase [Cyanobacteria bacterium J055]HIK32331.1 DNA-formamidopyrimidine glycosylase [Oscillatoriales cyanobacterium M4454_W2019_049]HIK50404.1 DNA-formamidopyrimidine glycosylase [Oscillatoriales cyanobacterium M59_W2019_021]